MRADSHLERVGFESRKSKPVFVTEKIPGFLHFFYKSIILPSVVYACETCAVNQGEEHKLTIKCLGLMF